MLFIKPQAHLVVAAHSNIVAQARVHVERLEGLERTQQPCDVPCPECGRALRRLVLSNGDRMAEPEQCAQCRLLLVDDHEHDALAELLGANGSEALA